MQVHHIKKFETYRELRTEVSNGITLCRACHLRLKGREELFELECTMLISNKEILGNILIKLNTMKGIDGKNEN